MHGKLIVFEGIDGCGKGTQIQLLQDLLSYEGRSHVLVKNPGTTRYGEEVRKLLFHTVKTHAMTPDSASLLYLASHVQLVYEAITPALRDGKIVIADRWDRISGHIYGNYGMDGVGLHAKVNELRVALAGPEPDLIIHLRGNPLELHRRANSRSETHQGGKRWNTAEKLSSLQDRYDTLLRGPNVLRVDTDGLSADAVFEVIRPVLGRLLG